MYSCMRIKYAIILLWDRRQYAGIVEAPVLKIFLIDLLTEDKSNWQLVTICEMNILLT